MPQSVHSIATHPLRLDTFVAALDGVRSRAHAQALIKNGSTVVAGRKQTKCAHMLVSGQDVVVTFPEIPFSDELTLETDVAPLSILYEDEACFVIDKPAGIAVHPGAGMSAQQSTVLDYLKPLFSDRSLPYSASHCLVHRLDKETTGCLIIAKTPVSHLSLQRAFQLRTVRKTYLAIVYGVPSPRKALINAPVGRHVSRRTTMSVTAASSSREARTAYDTFASSHGASLLSCDLQTGRTHQIRVHLSSVGHPVLGDQTYGNGNAASLAERHGISRLCLHAWKLCFPSPFNPHVSVESHPSDHFMQSLHALGMAL